LYFWAAMATTERFVLGVMLKIACRNREFAQPAFREEIDYNIITTKE